MNRGLVIDLMLLIWMYLFLRCRITHESFIFWMDCLVGKRRCTEIGFAIQNVGEAE